MRRPPGKKFGTGAKKKDDPGGAAKKSRGQPRTDKVPLGGGGVLPKGETPRLTEEKRPTAMLYCGGHKGKPAGLLKRCKKGKKKKKNAKSGEYGKPKRQPSWGKEGTGSRKTKPKGRGREKKKRRDNLGAHEGGLTDKLRLSGAKGEATSKLTTGGQKDPIKLLYVPCDSG